MHVIRSKSYVIKRLKDDNFEYVFSFQSAILTQTNRETTIKGR